jgi:hypothetical protein
MRNTTLYDIAGAVTFRRRSRRILPEKNKKNIGWGTNLQNQKKENRRVYITDGYSPALLEKCKHFLETLDHSIFSKEELSTLKCFAQTDQSGAEGLIVAFDCENKIYRQLFIHGINPHVYLGSRLFDIWPEEAKKHNFNLPEEEYEKILNLDIKDLKSNPYWKELVNLIKESDNWPIRYYYLAKQTGHSSNYGIEWHTFIMNVLEKSGGKVVIGKEEGQRFLLIHRTTFPEIVDRCRRIEQQVRSTGIIYNMFGHPFIITDKHLTDMKPYYAWGPQSTVGEITRVAATRLQDYIEEKKKSWDFLADTHDSILHQSPLYEIKDLAKMQQYFINIEFTSPIDGVKFRMKSETKIGMNWSERSEKNPLGLAEIKL